MLLALSCATELAEVAFLRLDGGIEGYSEVEEYPEIDPASWPLPHKQKTYIYQISPQTAYPTLCHGSFVS